MALTEWSTEDPAVVGEIRRYLPVIYGPPIRGRDSDHDHTFVIRDSVDATAGIHEVATRSDILLTWDAHMLPVMTGHYIREGLKVVLVSHSDGPHGANIGMEPGATHFAGVSRESLNVFSEEARNRAVIIHNGAEPDRVCPVRGRAAMRRIHGLDDSHFVIGYIGRFSEEKNPLASAVALQALGAGPKYYAVFVGPDEMGDFAERVAQIIPRERFVVCPPTWQVGDYLAMFDCLMAASHTEAFSLRIAEAWLAGVPVIATPIGHLPEVEKIHGPLTYPVTFRKHTPEELASAVRAVETRKDETRRIVEKARQVAWEHYTAPACAHRWTEYLVSLWKRSR